MPCLALSILIRGDVCVIISDLPTILQVCYYCIAPLQVCSRLEYYAAVSENIKLRSRHLHKFLTIVPSIPFARSGKALNGKKIAYAMCCSNKIDS